MNSKAQSLGGGPPEPLPTQPLVDYDAVPISRRRSVELWIVAIALCVPVVIAGLWGVYSVMLSEWSGLAEALLGLTFFLVLARSAWWRARGRHMDLLTGEDLQAAAVESRAMLQYLEHYDRLLVEAQAGAEGEGESDPVSRPEESGTSASTSPPPIATSPRRVGTSSRPAATRPRSPRG